MNSGIYVFMIGFTVGSVLIAAGVRVRPLDAVWARIRTGIVGAIGAARAKARR